jgi:pilus assembly protein CpaE
MIVAVYAVKGGSGRTTIAVNLAAALGLEHRGDCVLIDLSLPYNHAALVANLVPTGCLALIDQPDQDKFEDALLGIALHHPTGMVIIPTALRAEQAELVTPPLVKRALDVLEQTFNYMVVDLGVAMTDVTLGVLERANRILVMVTPELTSLKDTAELLQIFENVLKIPSARVSLVLNHPRPQTMVTRADAERQVERKFQAEIAYDGARFDRAAVTGQVVVETDPSCAASKSVIKLAGSITKEHVGAAKRVKV